MSSISVTLELILAMLLLAALIVGVRLERRLKTLREDQAGFGAAVAELNGAVLRAEAGLAELKAASQEAQTTLVDRIQDAKGAAAKLQQTALKAMETSQQLEAALARAPEMLARAVAANPGALPLNTPVSDVRERFALSRRPAPELEPSRADLLQARLPDPPPITRSRARVDDDLFVEPETPPMFASGVRR